VAVVFAAVAVAFAPSFPGVPSLFPDATPGHEAVYGSCLLAALHSV
jgi:hypothetical protein